MADKKQLKITQVKSVIRCTKPQKATIVALGLGRPNYSVIRKDGAALRGQLKAVEHLVKVEEVK
jgi:large subunit ribosomal protein L30